MRLIDTDKLPYEKMEISATSEEWCVRLSDIESAPTVDAVEVVRCKDCKHRVREDGRKCEIWLAFANSNDWFCADGEREEE